MMGINCICNRISFRMIDSALSFEASKTEKGRFLLDREHSQIDGLIVYLDGSAITAICAQTDPETREAILPYQVVRLSSYATTCYDDKDWTFFEETFDTLEKAMLFVYTVCENLFVVRPDSVAPRGWDVVNTDHDD